MITIAIDCRFASTLSGLGRYTRELVIELVKRRPSDVTYVLLVRSKDEAWIPVSTSRMRVVVADIAHYSLAEQLVLPSIIRESTADLLFSPHFNVPYFCPVPFVVTIHDLILHRYPNKASFLKRQMYPFLLSRSVHRARRIIAISLFVRSEIVDEYTDSVLQKITVVREGVSALYSPSGDLAKEHVRQKYALQRPFFLYVGNAKEHKNVRLLLDAFQKAGDTGHDLVLVTGGKEYERLRPIPPHVRKIEQVTDADMAALYSLAEAFVTATLYEGFCLPVAEALACGCPVIATNRSVLPEITEGRALLLEPTVDAYTKALQQTYTHTPAYRVGVWEKAAEETEQVLLEAARHF
jgi:glycosyltransferase involved in cell wall biosynthesis